MFAPSAVLPPFALPSKFVPTTLVLVLFPHNTLIFFLQQAYTDSESHWESICRQYTAGLRALGYDTLPRHIFNKQERHTWKKHCQILVRTSFPSTFAF